MKHTKQECVEILYNEMDANGKKILRDMTYYNLDLLHSSFGKYVKNKFKMWGNNSSEELRENEKNPLNADKMAMDIIRDLWHKLQKDVK